MELLDKINKLKRDKILKENRYKLDELKNIEFYDEDNELAYNQPFDFTTFEEFINQNKELQNINGQGFLSAIKKIFPVIGMISNIISPPKVDANVEAVNNVETEGEGIGYYRTRDINKETINGGFLSAVLPLVMQSLPGVISGFKELFTGKGIGDYSFSHNNNHYINPIEMSNHVFKEIHKLKPDIKLNKYKIKLMKGESVMHESEISLPLEKDELHYYCKIHNVGKGVGKGVGRSININDIGNGIGKGIGRGIGKGIGKGIGCNIDFKKNATFDKEYKNIGELNC